MVHTYFYDGEPYCNYRRVRSTLYIPLMIQFKQQCTDSTNRPIIPSTTCHDVPNPQYHSNGRNAIIWIKTRKKAKAKAKEVTTPPCNKQRQQAEEAAHSSALQH
ncbi:uncharacterized protein CIMG_04900 [Coccidioides immitis RS]|uniref:Uncharacterized protein n=1 Tax=Coccidioides immitis (strain RS) TaxID=246410 RepID=J3KEG0_COCIM|nr:uncharacterized protein CIMG_04900 [Coccidioides immitis RS]EAS33876.3 hypothetical protein CIMG_04900 [Coccidioides immitis RS]